MAIYGYGPGALWFWIAALLLWRGLCSSTLGAPNALLMAAGRSAEDADLFDRLARRNVAETAASWRRGGIVTAAFGGFLGAFVTAFAVVRPSLFTLDVFAVVAPALVFAAASARAALSLEREQPDPPTLRARFLRLRALGFAAMLASFALIAGVRIAVLFLP